MVGDGTPTIGGGFVDDGTPTLGGICAWLVSEHQP